MTINYRPYDLISLDDNIGPQVLNSQDRQSSNPSAVDAFRAFHSRPFGRASRPSCRRRRARLVA